MVECFIVSVIVQAGLLHSERAVSEAMLDHTAMQAPYYGLLLPSIIPEKLRQKILAMGMAVAVEHHRAGPLGLFGRHNPGPGSGSQTCATFSALRLAEAFPGP